MKDDIIRLSHKISFITTAIAAVCAPLFFLPLTSEFFELNKFTLLLILTIISTINWSLKMVLQKKFSYTKSPLDIPLLIFVGALVVSSFSSIDQYISIFGSPNSKWPSLLGVATLIVFYFSNASSIKSKKEVHIILTALLASTTLAAVIAIFAYFNIFPPFDFTKYRSFNTLGSPNRLAVLISIVLPIAVAFMVFINNRLCKMLSAMGSVILIVCLILINFPPAYFGLIAGLITAAAASLKIKITKETLGGIIGLGVIVILISALRFIPSISSITLGKILYAGDNTSQKIDVPKPITINQRTGWNIALSTIANPNRALFGTGPGTFQFVYTQLKPRAINTTENWAVRFDKSSSEFSELIATAGIIGALAFLFFTTTAARLAWKLIFKSPAGLNYVPISAGIISAVTLAFFTTFSVSAILTLFICLICLSVMARIQDEKYIEEMTIEVATLKNSFNWLPTGSSLASLKTAPSDASTGKSQVLPLIFLLSVSIISIFVLFNQISTWRAEYIYRQAILALNQNDGAKTINLLLQAIRINSSPDIYHRVLSQTALSAAINLNQKKDLSDDEKNLLSRLVQVSIEQAKFASGYQILPLRVPGISAANVANWETLSSAYQSVIASVQGSDVHAVNSLSQAVLLDPQNPILHDQLGLLQQRLKNPDSAQRKFEDSILTKNDYGPAYYHLAKLLIEKSANPAKIADALTAAKRYLPKEDPALPDIEKNLEDYNKKVEEQKTQPVQPTPAPVVSPSPSPEKSTKTSASPSPSPAEIPPSGPSPSPSL